MGTQTREPRFSLNNKALEKEEDMEKTKNRSPGVGELERKPVLLSASQSNNECKERISSSTPAADPTQQDEDEDHRKVNKGGHSDLDREYFSWKGEASLIERVLRA